MQTQPGVSIGGKANPLELCEPCDVPPPPPEPVGFVDFNVDEAIGGFAMMCRCGRQRCSTHIQPAPDTGRVVLSPEVEPDAYDLALTLRLEDHAFDGVGEAVSTVTDDKSSTATFSFGSSLPRGKGRLSIAYTGELNNQMCGFYRSTYTNVHGEEKLMASTQFESIDARRCFPGWDEPRRKATFTCSLRVPSHMVALSNMPESMVHDHGDGTKTVSFMPTPRMSTYLLAFVVGEFDYLSKISKNGVLIRVFCPPGKPHLGRFALECAVAALDAYDDTFQIRYPLPKSDMVAIPEFAAGAMENWGLVTYREVDLLIDDRCSASRQLQRVAEVVIHELAHQWFGNLVTMEWWDDLWLNEGFATWMETGVCAKLHPEWSMWEQFITDMQGQALKLDAMRSSHPIQVPIAHAEEVEQVFDAISYCKGGSVVRMVHAVLGERDFTAGLRAYMSQFAYGNATTEDLWGAWEKASGQPIKKMMGQWTRQMGFPLLELKGAWAVGGRTTLELSQRWFLADGSIAAPSEEKVWMIPVFAQASGAPESGAGTMHLLPAAPEHSITIEGDGEWVKLNAGQHVPMRVRYPDGMIAPLCSAIRDKAFGAADRIGLLSDQAALSRAGMLDPALYLQVLSAYATEDDATVWSMMLEQLHSLHSLLTGASELLAPFDAFARSMLLGKLSELGWTPRSSDGHLTRKLRGELIGVLPAFCASDESVVAEARRRFDTFVADPVGAADELPSEYQQAVYKLVLKAGGRAEFDALMRLFHTLPLNEQKKAALAALGSAPSPELRTEALEFAISGKVKLQDFFYVSLSMHGSGPDGLEATWTFFKANVERYSEMLAKASPSLMDAVITGACRGFATADKAAEVRAFFEGHPMARNERKIAQVLEGIETNAKYLEAFKASGALAWLNNYTSEP